MSKVSLQHGLLVVTIGMAGCAGSTEPTNPPANGPGYGSVTGVVRGSGTGYPVNGNGIPGERALGWPLLAIVAEASGQSSALEHEDRETGSFRFDGLAAGEWTLRFIGLHPWPGVFPGMRLYADTAIAVTILPNQTVVLAEVEPRPLGPFIVVATQHCPWALPNLPTYADWGDCDGGYWGGVDVEVEVQGIPGTPTEGQRYSISMKDDEWFLQLRNIPAGEYEASIVPGPGPCPSGWRLLPWQQSPIRLRVERGLAYAEFDFWCESWK